GSAQRHRGGPAYAASQTQTLRVLAAACGRAACGRAVEMTGAAKPCGFRTHLGNRFAIPTFPPPRRLLDSFNTKSRKELSSAIPSGFLQAHSSIRKDFPQTQQCPHLPPYLQEMARHMLQLNLRRGIENQDIYGSSSHQVASASPNRLGLRSLAPRICSYIVDLRAVPKPSSV